VAILGVPHDSGTNPIPRRHRFGAARAFARISALYTPKLRDGRLTLARVDQALRCLATFFTIPRPTNEKKFRSASTGCGPNRVSAVAAFPIHPSAAITRSVFPTVRGVCRIWATKRWASIHFDRQVDTPGDRPSTRRIAHLPLFSMPPTWPKRRRPREPGATGISGWQGAPAKG